MSNEHTENGSEAKLSTTACPRCGCHLVQSFKCSCGAVHDDHCVNCGRWATLAPDQHVELDESMDVRCDKGFVDHTHSPEEKSKRISDSISGKQ